MTDPMMHLSPLPPGVAADLDSRRRWVASVLAPVPPGFGRDADGLVAGILVIAGGRSAAGALPPTDTWSWQSLGVALGDVFCLDTPGAAWVQVTDEFGTDAVVRPVPGADLIVGAMTMLSKRVEAGEPVDAELVAGLRGVVAQRAAEWRAER